MTVPLIFLFQNKSNFFNDCYMVFWSTIGVHPAHFVSYNFLFNYFFLICTFFLNFQFSLNLFCSSHSIFHEFFTVPVPLLLNLFLLLNWLSVFILLSLWLIFFCFLEFRMSSYGLLIQKLNIHVSRAI